jgi:uncharacterized protein (TIGR02996 family)
MQATLLGLLDDCKRRPDEDHPRLILADWLEDHGDSARAEFIRLQCRQGTDDDDPLAWPDRDRAHDLLAQHGSAWLGPLQRRGWQCSFRRGLIQVNAGVVTLRQSTELSSDPELAWVENVTTGPAGPDLCRLLGDPILRGIGGLTFQGKVGLRVVKAVAGSPTLNALTSLSLVDCKIGTEVARALADSPRLGLLRHLDLSGNKLGGFGFQALARSPHLGNLRSLNLTRTQMMPEDAEELARSSWFGNLRRLSLSENSIRDRGLAAFAAARPAPPLTFFRLGQSGIGINRNPSGIGPDGFAALARSPMLKHLEHLELRHTPLAPAAVAALLGSSHLERLVILDLQGCTLGPKAWRELARCPGRQYLRRLDLGQTGLDREGAEHLARAELLVSVTDLRLESTFTRERGAGETLLTSPHLSRLEALRLYASCDDANGLALLTRAPFRECLQVLDLCSNVSISGDLGVLLCKPWPRLHDLNLCYCDLIDEDIDALVAAPGLGQLRNLNLSYSYIETQGLAVLADWPGLGRLRFLDLGETALGDAGVRTLARSPHLGELRELGLANTSITPAVVPELVRLLASSQVLRLDLGENRLGDALVPALLTEPAFRRLARLSLNDNGLSEPAQASLLAHFGETVVL